MMTTSLVLIAAAIPACQEVEAVQRLVQKFISLDSTVKERKRIEESLRAADRFTVLRAVFEEIDHAPKGYFLSGIGTESKRRLIDLWDQHKMIWGPRADLDKNGEQYKYGELLVDLFASARTDYGKGFLFPWLKVGFIDQTEVLLWKELKKNRSEWWNIRCSGILLTHAPRKYVPIIIDALGSEESLAYRSKLFRAFPKNAMAVARQQELSDELMRHGFAILAEEAIKEDIHCAYFTVLNIELLFDMEFDPNEEKQRYKDEAAFFSSRVQNALDWWRDNRIKVIKPGKTDE